MNADEVVFPFVFVVLHELCTQTPGFAAYDWIGARVVRAFAIENLDTNQVFLQLSASALQRLLYDESEKPAHPIGPRKGLTR